MSDKRKPKGLRYRLETILVVMTLAKICGEDNPNGVADWAEVRIGVRSILLCVLALLVIWVFTFSSYDPTRHNGLTFGIGTGLLSAALIYAYWKQEAARPKNR